MEAWYVFQKISYLYICLTVFTVIFLITSFLLPKNKTRSSCFFLALAGTFFGFSVLSFAAETYFYFNYGSLFYNKSVFAARSQYKVTKDLDLIEEDISKDVVDLGNFFYQEINWNPSANAKYKIDQDGQNILLSSIDNKPAYLEMMFTRRLNYPDQIYQIQLSFFVKNVLDSLSYISTFEKINGKPFQHRVFCDASFQKCENYLLSSFFYRSRGKQFNGSSQEFRARLYTTGQEVSFFKPKLTAVKVYSPLWSAKNPEPIYVPVSRLNNLREKETASKNLARVGDLSIHEITGSETTKNFYHWDPNNNKSSQKITVAKNISLSKDNLENLKGIQFNYKNSNPDNPMQISFGIHTSGMKFHIPIEHFNENKNLKTLTQLPSETIDFATSLILRKGPLYLVKRILGLPFDENWRLSQVGKRNLIQRRFHKNLNNVNNINIVFSRELDNLVVLEENLVRLLSDDKESRLKVSCNLRLSRGRFSNNIILAQGELPVKIFNSSGHWVLQIDLKEYLHSNKTLFLEELLLFIPANTNEIIAGRVVSSLIFGKQGKVSNSPNIFTGVNGDEYTQDQRIFATMDSPNDVINKLGKSRKRIFLNLSNLKDVIKNRSGWGFFSEKRNVIEEVFLFAKPKKPGPKSSFFMSEPNIVFAKSGPLKSTDDHLKIHRKSRNRFHQEAINRKKDDSTIRILFLGGSTMAGLGTGPSSTFPLLFKGMLKSIGSSSDGKKFDIVNAGQSGNTTYGYLYQYDKTDAFAGSPWDGSYFLKTPTDSSRFVLKDLKADIVIIAPVYNDQVFFNAYPSMFEQLYEDKVSINQVLKPFRGNFVFQYNAIGHYIYKGAYGYLHNKALLKNTSYTENENLRLYKNRLRLLAKKILKDSKKIVFLLFPAKEKDPYHYYYLNDKKIFNEIAAELNFPVYDLNENNLNQNRKGYWYDFIHPTANGYNDYAVKFFNLLFSEKSPYLKINWEDH